MTACVDTVDNDDGPSNSVPRPMAIILSLECVDIVYSPCSARSSMLRRRAHASALARSVWVWVTEDVEA